MDVSKCWNHINRKEGRRGPQSNIVGNYDILFQHTTDHPDAKVVGSNRHHHGVYRRPPDHMHKILSLRTIREVLPKGRSNFVYHR